MWLFLEDDKKPKAFVSCSLRKEDQRYVDMIIRITKQLGFLPVGTVGKFEASPKPIWQQMAEGIKSADCLILIATPRYIQKDVHDRKKTGKGISEMLHVEVGMAVMAGRPILAFAQKGTNVGSFLPQTVQYIELDYDNKDLNDKWQLIKRYFKNAMKIIKRRWEKEDNKELAGAAGIILGLIGAAKVIDVILAKRTTIQSPQPLSIPSKNSDRGIGDLTLTEKEILIRAKDNNGQIHRFTTGQTMDIIKIGNWGTSHPSDNRSCLRPIEAVEKLDSLGFIKQSSPNLYELTGRGYDTIDKLMANGYKLPE